MSKLFFVLILFFTTYTFGQQNDRILLKGKANLLSTWSWKTEKSVSSMLLSGDYLIVKMQAQTGIEVLLMHNNKTKRLITINETEDLFIQCFEYDFDKDGNSEIIIASSPEAAALNVFIFKYSNDLSELVGSFSGSYEIELNRNEIFLPVGSHGIGTEFIFRNGSFYEMNYHSPKLN